MNPKFDRNKFLLNQKRMSFKEKYYVYDEDGHELFYVERPFRLFGRRNITIFEDDSKQTPVLFINQEHYWELLRRNYTLTDADGEVLARFSRNNVTSLFLRGWDVMDPSGVCTMKAREDSIPKAIIRRLVDFIPFVGLLGGLIKTDFHFMQVDSSGNEKKIGSFDRRISLFDKYVLNLAEDTDRTLDRRTALALGVLLDTAEKR